MDATTFIQQQITSSIKLMQIRLPLQSICLDLVSAGGFIISCSSFHPAQFLYTCMELHTICNNPFPKVLCYRELAWDGVWVWAAPSLKKAIGKQQWLLSHARERRDTCKLQLGLGVIEFFNGVHEVEQLKNISGSLTVIPFPSHTP